MILLFIYVIFQIIFDHWADNSVGWRVVYFAFQYGWVAAVAVRFMFTEKNKIVYLLFSILFAALAVNELTYLKADTGTYSMMSSAPPALSLTIAAVILFFLYEIIWKKLSNYRGQI